MNSTVLLLFHSTKRRLFNWNHQDCKQSIILKFPTRGREREVPHPSERSDCNVYSQQQLYFTHKGLPKLYSHATILQCYTNSINSQTGIRENEYILQEIGLSSCRNCTQIVLNFREISSIYLFHIMCSTPLAEPSSLAYRMPQSSGVSSPNSRLDKSSELAAPKQTVTLDTNTHTHTHTEHYERLLFTLIYWKAFFMYEHKYDFPLVRGKESGRKMNKYICYPSPVNPCKNMKCRNVICVHTIQIHLMWNTIWDDALCYSNSDIHGNLFHVIFMLHQMYAYSSPISHADAHLNIKIFLIFEARNVSSSKTWRQCAGLDELN